MIFRYHVSNASCYHRCSLLAGEDPQAPPVCISTICSCTLLRNTNGEKLKKVMSTKRAISPNMDDTTLYVGLIMFSARSNSCFVSESSPVNNHPVLLIRRAIWLRLLSVAAQQDGYFAQFRYFQLEDFSFHDHPPRELLPADDIHLFLLLLNCGKFPWGHSEPNSLRMFFIISLKLLFCFCFFG